MPNPDENLSTEAILALIKETPLKKNQATAIDTVEKTMNNDQFQKQQQNLKKKIDYSWYSEETLQNDKENSKKNTNLKLTF